MITFKITFNSKEEHIIFKCSIPDNVQHISSFDFKEIYIFSKLDFFIPLHENNNYNLEKLQHSQLSKLYDNYLENYIRYISTFEEILNFNSYFDNLTEILSSNDYFEIAYFNSLLNIFQKEIKQEYIDFIINNLYILEKLTNEYSYDFIFLFLKNSQLNNIDFILNKLLENNKFTLEHLKNSYFLIENNKLNFLNKIIDYKKQQNRLDELLFLLQYYKSDCFLIFKPIFHYFTDNFIFNKNSYRRKLFSFFHTIFIDTNIYHLFKPFLLNNNLFYFFQSNISDGIITTFNEFHRDYFFSQQDKNDLYIEFFKNDSLNKVDILYLIKMVEQNKALDYDPIIISRIEEYQTNEILKNF